MRGIQVYRCSGLLLSSLLFSLAGGCAAKNEDASARPAPKTAEVTSEEAHHGRSFRVGVLLPSGGEQSNATLRQAMQDAAQTNNLILTFETSQTQQPSAPIALLRSQKVDALLVCARNNEDARILARSGGEGDIPLVALVSEPQHAENPEKRKQTGETQANPLPGVMAEIAPRIPSIGTTVGERLNAALHGTGGVVLITGNINTLNAMSGVAWNDLRDYLHRHPALQVLESHAGPLPAGEGLKMLDRRGVNLHAIVCDDELALRSLAKICRQKKRADVVLFAFDAGRATLTMIQQPVQNAGPKPMSQVLQNAVVQKIGFTVPAAAPGKLAVQTIAACLRGEKPRPRVWADAVPVPIAAPALFATPAVKSTLIVTPRSTISGEKTP